MAQRSIYDKGISTLWKGCAADVKLGWQGGTLVQGVTTSRRQLRGHLCDRAVEKLLHTWIAGLRHVVWLLPVAIGRMRL